MTVRIVTDSTCDLPQDIIAELGITVVPLYINIGERGYLDGVEISRRDFYQALPDYPTHPTTAAPGPQTFQEVYNQLAVQGASQILSIHISKSLSAVLDSARQAADAFHGTRVTVRDSQQLSLGTGFQVETAARMARDDAPLADILAALDDLSQRAFVAAALDTLEFLHRSGRMNAFMVGLGSFLQIKPILTMRAGQPASERVRTAAKAEARLVELLEENQPLERFAIVHTHAPEKAALFQEKVAGLTPPGRVYNMDITPVIGAHIGPGAVGYALIAQSK